MIKYCCDETLCDGPTQHVVEKEKYKLSRSEANRRVFFVVCSSGALCVVLFFYLFCVVVVNKKRLCILDKDFSTQWLPVMRNKHFHCFALLFDV